MTTDLSVYLDQAQRAGAESAEVYYSRSFSRPVFFEANRLKQLESSESEGLALRLWKNGQSGLAVAYGPVEPDILVEKALALAALNPPNPPRFTAPRQDYRESLGEDFSVEQLIDWGKTAIADIRDQFPEVLCNGELACSTDSSRLLNSEGLDCAWTERSLSYYFGVEWIRGEDFLAIYDGEQCREKANIKQVIQNLRQRLLWAEENQQIQGGKMPILLTSGAASLLWDTVAEALNGQRVAEGSSPWADKLGQSVAIEALNLSQDPTAIPFDSPFDDEGSLTQTLALIQNGEIAQFYTDHETAEKLGTTTTGNGFRPGLGSAPQPGLVNMLITPGTISFDQLLKELGNGLIIDQILGGGADISGDFSINVDLGYRVQNGQITGRVKDTMVSGNVYELLNQIVTLGSDHRWQGSCSTPSVIVNGASVTV
ncbi:MULTISPECIES: TldD/PmbA family protein [unclassified Synechocystis]|uniref:TldD/PmbA family protein n=1 Tax=unclassified Synechocystis TaxID=2640012 RepID=UPI000419A43B|nr:MULTISPECIES: TldD/PmbA family protein [unclassified Synechocystis]AIE72597.1 TldE protein, part of TldE/TldD proteolytic complex [Synechocystis sp. PCC 6714]MCT0254514.1 TldD/PmbA family protein [Synechocystis sp. CS-94]